MSRNRLKARDRITQKMTKDGLVERNETTSDNQRISKRDAEYDLRDSVLNGNLKNADNQSARSNHQSYSQVGNKQADTAESTTKRNKAAYRQHSQAAKDAEKSLLQPESAQKQPVRTSSHELSPPFHSLADNPSSLKNQQKEAIGDNSGDVHCKIEIERNSSLLHDKPSLLQNAAASTLKAKPPDEPALKHDSSRLSFEEHTPDSSATRKKRRVNALQDDSEAATSQTEVAEKQSAEPVQSTSQSYSQVGNKQKPRNGRNNNAYRQENITPIQHEQSTSDSPLTHRSGESESTLFDGNSQQSDTTNTSSQKQSAFENATNKNPNVNEAESANQPPKTDIDSASTNKINLQTDKDSKLQSDKSSKLKFGVDEAPPKPPPKSRGLAKAEKGVERTNAKLDKAKDNLPTKKKISSRLVFDEEKGKSKRELFIEKQTKTQAEHLKGPLPFRPIKSGVNSALNFTHGKIFQVEHENVEIKAAHRGEMAAEGGVRGALRYHKLRKYRKAGKLEQKLMKKNVNLTYRQVLEKNPKLKSNMLSRMWQKRKIKKQYAKAARDAKKAAGGVKKAGSLSVRATRFVVKAIIKNPKVLLILLVAGLVIAAIMALMSLFMSIGGGGFSAVIATTYLSEETDIDNAALAYTEWEAELMSRIANIESEFPGFDEYRLNVDMVDHSPLELMAYLTAVHHIFTYPEIRDALRELFEAQYQLSFTESIETRYRDDVDEEGNPIQVPYEWSVLTVNLTSRSLTDIIHERMTDDQRQHFQLLMMTSGQRQFVGSPFDFNWLPFISSNYGWRIHPISGQIELHRGIDIALPAGTPILAAHNGVVTFAGEMDGYGNVVFIVGADGIETRYAHCDTVLVTVGQEVSAGDQIATVGNTGVSTGAHLHFEILRNGVYLNPIFFAHSNTGTGGWPDFGDPGLPMGDGTFEALLELGEALFGRPYVWGASGPNSFDCSGLVYFLLNQSGAATVGRTTAQGYFNMSRPVSPSEAMPGDLIFFEGTFSSARTITHVGVYLGDGRMLHTGSNPNGVEIVSINTPFWQRHFHSFGRLVDF